MNRRNFLKTILGGIAAVSFLKGITPATTIEKTEEVTDHASRSIGYANMAHPNSGTIILLPDSSRGMDEYPKDIRETTPQVIRFSNRLLDNSFWGWTGTSLKIANKPIINDRIYVHTRKCSMQLSAEFVHNYLTLEGKVDFIVEMAVKEMLEKNYKWFHSILLVPYIQPDTFEMGYSVLVRGA